MAQTKTQSRQINTVQRSNLDTTTTSSAVIAKVIAGTNVTISQTGADAGTGDVTINAGGTKVSALTAAAAVNLTDTFPIVQSGTTKSATLQNVATLFADTLQNSSTADQSPAAATLTLITGSTINVPAAKLRAGTVFLYRLQISKTAAGTAASSFYFRLGTAGTTADVAIITFTLPVGTAAADVGQIDITVTIRAATSTATAQGMFTMSHNGNTTGLATIPVVGIKVTSASFDATAASLIASLSVTSGASTVYTFSQVAAQVINL